MIKTILLCLLFPAIITSQTNHIESVLYEIKSKNGEKTSYLFGQTEKVRSGYLEKHKTVFDAIQNAEKILMAFEDSSDEFDIIMKGSSLYDLMSRDEIIFLKQTLELYGYDLNYYLFTYPIVTVFALIALSQHDSDSDRVEFLNDEISELEQSIRATAYRNDISVEELCSIEDMLGVLNINLSLNEQKDHLMEVLDYISSYGKISIPMENDINDFFYDNDIDYLNRFFDLYVTNIKIFSIIIEFLNTIALQNILKSIEDQNLFISAYIDQLPFDYGLIELLKKEGYEVSPVRF